MHPRGIGHPFAASLMFGLGVVLAKLVGSEIDCLFFSSAACVPKQ
jgi:hypothetical protein